ncbi:helix-turn-helix transcriptional regulator [Dactylosporangium sp. AC04546]|uniref:helix-turn-helix domain-containing protein n=1 Tax=Dactylosporangium sp. AC04546 TaxID=2862460 RepID=UPI001EDC9F90|nr:helix-turn-helix transcriptional regulator [Dactylosporangium sp. AC04546]WVK78209.1 helix-turn-helix transcriptional regulator [Dactylosporangium sp. AC04546]
MPAAEDDDVYDHIDDRVAAPRRPESLAARIGELVQAARARHNLTQAELAARAAVSQGAISKLERGSSVLTTALIERVFAALDLQLRVETEPAGTDLDAEIEQLRNRSEEDIAAELDALGWLFGPRHLGGLPYVLSGRLAALIQGAPLNAMHVDLAVRRDDLDAFAKRFAKNEYPRWVERLAEFAGLGDPREPGPMRWEVGADEIRLEVHDTPVRALSVKVGARTYRVRPLADVAAEHPDVARVLRRAAVTQDT